MYYGKKARHTRCAVRSLEVQRKCNRVAPNRAEMGLCCSEAVKGKVCVNVAFIGYNARILKGLRLVAEGGLEPPTHGL